MIEQYCSSQAAVTVQIKVRLSYKLVNKWKSEDRASHTMQNNAIEITVNVIHININANMSDKWTVKETKFENEQSFRTKNNIFTFKTTKKKKTLCQQLAELKSEIESDLISILNEKIIQVSMMQYVNINSSIKIFINKTFKFKLKLIIIKTIRSKMTKMTKNK